MDVANDAAGREYLKTRYGLRTVPVIARGDRYVKAVKIDDVDLFAHHAAVSERENGLERIRVIDLATRNSHAIDLPEPAYELSIDQNTEFKTSTLRFRYQSLISPSSIFDYAFLLRELGITR